MEERKETYTFLFKDHPITRLVGVKNVSLENGKTELRYSFRYHIDGKPAEAPMKFVANIYYGFQKYIIVVPCEQYFMFGNELPADTGAEVGIVFRAFGDGKDYEYILDRKLTETIFERYRRLYPSSNVRSIEEALDEFLAHSDVQVPLEFIEDPKRSGDPDYPAIGDEVTLKNLSGDLLHTVLKDTLYYNGELYCLFNLHMKSEPGDPPMVMLCRCVKKDAEHPKNEYYYIRNDELIDAVLEEYNKDKDESF